jgi:hypothetical protein
MIPISELRAAAHTLNKDIPIRLLNVLTSRRFGSISAKAFSYFHSSEAMDIIVGAGWPIQIDGCQSLLCEALELHLIGLIPLSKISRLIQPILQSPDRVDLRATGTRYKLNPVQLALLTGDADLLDSILSVFNNMPNMDLHRLVSSHGSVNMFHRALAISSRNSIASVFRLMLSRQIELGFYMSLCYEDTVDPNLNVIESLIRRRFHEPLLLLLEKGASLYSPVLRACNFQPSLWHLAFFDRWDASIFGEFLSALEPVFLSKAVITQNILDMPFNGTGSSLLAAIARAPNLALFTKALSLASELQKNLALLELAKETDFFATHEELLLNAGASLTQNAITVAARAGAGTRILFMIRVKGSGIAEIADSNGLFLANYFAEALNQSDQPPDQSSIFPALKALLEPEVVKQSTVALTNVQASLKKFADRHASSIRTEKKKLAAEALELHGYVTTLLHSAR